MRRDNDGSEAWVENRDGTGGRPVKVVESQAVSTDQGCVNSREVLPGRTIRGSQTRRSRLDRVDIESSNETCIVFFLSANRLLNKSQLFPSRESNGKS